ncbi:hypothetical protein [Methylomonas sp. CM2]|uniref:hypothetical protein n=1 Tax=Methylomonas sp. CM2 TaxID=3417647 RepID=UPI003CF85896
MPRSPNRHLLFATLLLGLLLASLIYAFHPEVGEFNLTINGQPVASPLFRLAAIPTLLAVFALFGILAVLALVGVGMMLFFAALGFALLGVFLIVPYSWPLLLLFGLLFVGLVSSGNPKNKD